MCLVVIVDRKGNTTMRKIPIVTVGRRRRAVTPEELQQHQALRQQQDISTTMVCGGSNHKQRITRCAYSQEPEWCRKDPHHRAMARDGDRSLRDKYRARTRRTALVD